MPDYDNTNRGAIWKNEDKETDRHPDFRGTYTDENGTEFWVSAWKRGPDANPRAPSLTFRLTRKTDTTKATPDTTVSRNSEVDIDPDDVPF